MRRFALRSIALFAVAMSAAAGAADMPLKVPPPSPAAPAWDWSGFYLGGNIGYGVGHDPTLRTTGGLPFDTYELAPAGALGGGQIGYNSQVGKWVFGIEADWQWTHQTDTTCSDTCASSGGIIAYHTDPSVNSLGTVRGRIGFAQDRSLWYVTGGGAWGRVDDNFFFVQTNPIATGAAVAAHNRGGWVAGGGVETALAGAWSAKLEYLYVDLGGVTDAFTISGTTTSVVTSSTIHDHIVRLGLNYRFGSGVGFDATTGADSGITSLVYKAPPATARTVYNWTGFYVGANVGYSIGRDQTNTFQSQALVPAGNALNEAFKLSPAGLLAGPQIGANWQTGKLVLGVEADWQKTSQEDYACLNDCNGVFNITYDQSLRWFGTVRARVGIAQDRTLWYVTGGGAWGKVDDNFSLSSTFFDVFPSVSATHVLSGWTAGGGVETALGGPWTAKLEYLYVDLGSVTDSYTTPLFGGTTFANTTWIRDNIIRGGLNYRLGDPTPWDTADSPLAATIFYKAPPAPSCIWCGWYIGVNAGDAYSRNGFSNAASATPDAALGVPPGVSEGLAALATGSVPLGANGFIGGTQAGYNWQIGTFVPGVEADIEGFSRSGAARTVATTAVVVGASVTTTQTAAMSTSYLGTVRGRLGVLVTPTWLPYVTGGLAYGGVKASDTVFQVGTNGFFGGDTASLVDTRLGWAVGAGFEWMFAPRWSAKAEYLHYDLGYGNFTNLLFGNVLTFFYQTDAVSAHFSGDIVRAGINYHFESPGSGPSRSY